jgi:hypothetical protein
MSLRLLPGIIGLLASGLCSAGGSVEFKVVDQLIRQQPSTYRWLSSTLVFPDTAFAEVRFGPHFKHLSGERMGPYTFVARPMASSAGSEIEIIVCTDAHFIDKSGEHLAESRIAEAARLEEKLASVQVRDRRDAAGSPACPN